MLSPSSVSLPFSTPRLAALLASAALAAATTAAAPVPPRFARTAVALPQPAWGVNAIDVDRDGRRDLVVIGDTQIYAALAPDWRLVVLADVQAGRLLHCVAVDCDRDGDLDLVIGRNLSPWVQAREAQAAGKAPKSAPVGPDFGIAWVENTGRTDRPAPVHVVDADIHGVHGMWAGDVDGDGRTDFVAGSFQGPQADSIALYTARRDAPGFVRSLVAARTAPGRAHYLDLADLDGDRRSDVLLAASTGGFLSVWHQPASPGAAWPSTRLALEPGVTNVRAFDVDGDGRPDAVASNGHGTGLNWFRAPTWERHAIDVEVRDAHAFDAADLDGDGDSDLALASFSQHRVLWYENRGRGTFARHVVDEGNAQQAYDLKIADVDGDRLPDLLIAGRQSRNVVLYRQLAAP